MSKPFRSISVDSKDELKQRILKWILVDDRSVDPNTFYLLDLSNETRFLFFWRWIMMKMNLPQEEFSHG